MRYLAVFSFFISIASAQVPVGIQKWQYDDTTYALQMGGMPRNYLNGGSWTQINNEFTVDGDSAICNTALLKTTVKRTGEVKVTFTWNDIDYEITQHLNRIIFFRKSDSSWINIDNTPNWTIPDIDSNQITWSNVFPGVDYGVEKHDGIVRNPIIFKPAFLDSAVTLYNQRADSLDLYLGSVHVYTLSATIDSYNVHIGNVPRRILKRFGGLIFDIGKQWIDYPSNRPDAAINAHVEYPVYQRWVFVGQTLYQVEFVKMSDLKAIHTAHPSEYIMHYDSKTIDNDTDIKDASTTEGQGNFDGQSYMYTYGIDPESFKSRCFIVNYNLSDSLGAGVTFDSSVIHFTVYDHYDNDYLVVAGIWKDEIDITDFTWDVWDADGEKSWGTAGAQFEVVIGEGFFNSTSGDDPDITTGLDSLLITGTGAKSINYGSAWSQECYDEAASGHGITLTQQNGGSGSEWIRTRERGSNMPYFVHYYTVSGSGVDMSYARRKKMAGD